MPMKKLIKNYESKFFVKNSNSPLLKPISFDKAKEYSPWPNRILGIDKWKKEQREPSDVIKEYDDLWYKEALDYYEQHLQSYQGKKNPGGAVVFIRDLENNVPNKLKKIDNALFSADCLVSFGDQLYLGNSRLLRLLSRNYITEIIGYYMRFYGLKSVIEMGSGIGINLFNTFLYYGAEYIRGGELCGNSRELSNKIATDFGVNGEFIDFDYYKSEDINRLCDYDKDYILITAHSIEQLPYLPDYFIDQVINLKNPPKAILHFEPIQFPQSNIFDSYCKKYSEINLYNQDLFYKLNDAHNAKKIKVLHVGKHVIGFSAFNPTSVLVWEPISKR